MVDDFSALPDDERLLTLANGVSTMSFAGFGGRPVATREGKETFTGDKPATVSIDLWPEWLKGQHTISISGVFLDETGRENRATGTFSLTPVGEKSVAVSTPKEMYATGEKCSDDHRTASTTRTRPAPRSSCKPTPARRSRCRRFLRRAATESSDVTDNTHPPLGEKKGSPRQQAGR